MCRCNTFHVNERLYRSQILLRPEQHRRLVLLSQEQGKGISEVARNLIDEALLGHQSAVCKTRGELIQRMRAFRNDVERMKGVMRRDLVGEAREEREAERFRQ